MLCVGGCFASLYRGISVLVFESAVYSRGLKSGPALDHEPPFREKGVLDARIDRFIGPVLFRMQPSCRDDHGLLGWDVRSHLGPGCY